MGVDTKLWISSSHEVRDLVTVLEHHLNLDDMTVKNQVYNPGSKTRKYKTVTSKVKTVVRSNHEIAPGFFHIDFSLNGERRMMCVHLNVKDPLGSHTLLSLGHNEQAVKIMRTIAEALGGLVMENDCDGAMYVMESEYLNDNDGAAYFMKEAALTKRMDNSDDLEGVKELAEEFYKKHGR